MDDESLKNFDQLETNLKKANEEIKRNLISNDKLVQMEIKIENFLKLEKEVCEKDAVIEGLEKKINKIEKLVEKISVKKVGEGSISRK